MSAESPPDRSDLQFARIYLGAHNPLDVTGGVGLGLAGAAVNHAVGVPRRIGEDARV